MTSAQSALRIHKGHTTHRRFSPFKSSFKYRLALIDVDVDRLDEAGKQTRLFSVEQATLFSFRRRDHGEKRDQPLRPWVEDTLQKAGLKIPNGAIRLVTFPRHTFYKFAPISLWLCLDRQNEPKAIVYEVRNTFGERHCYVAPVDGVWSTHDADKRFHVSPFFDVSGKYKFSLRLTEDELHLGVTTMKDGAPLHSATMVTRIENATDGAFLKTALTMPFSTIGVTMGIHWEALKLWIKGAKYHSKPPKTEQSPTLAVSSAALEN